jgi:bifunctional DNA-binding transcriptional regulator/antitoxin component of YhaV-PrlF toxin-antitoxin module
MSTTNLGVRRPQKVKTSFVLTIPKLWINQFKLEDLSSLEIFMDENKNLVIKAPKSQTPINEGDSSQ